MNKEDIIKGLSDEQKRAVTTIKGNIRLIAGAGSGKTSALTKRVAYICATENISPSRVLSVTFTNKAAKEMKERVSKLLEVPEDELHMMTFHRLALNICKKFLSKIGYPVREEDGEEVADINIGSTPVSAVAKEFFSEHQSELNSLNDEERKLFINAVIRYTKSVIKGHKYVDRLLSDDITVEEPGTVIEYETQKSNSIKEQDKIKRKISNLRAEIRNNYSKSEDCYEYYYSIRKYQNKIQSIRNQVTGDSPTKTWARQLLKKKIATKTLDFDDIIMFADYLLTNFDDVREYWQNQYDYIQVDEFQDTDYIQLHILQLLSGKHHNLFMVGDPDQSIYQFRGVKPEVFNTLDERLDELNTLFMKNNYRSSKAVVNSANSIIKLNKNRIKKELIPASVIEDIEAPVFCTSNGTYTTAQFEYSQIRQMIDAGVNPDDICVLYRDKTCDLTDELVRILRNTDIPLDCQYQRTTFADTFEDITLNLLKYRHSSSANFLGNFIDGIFGEDYTEIFDNTQIDAVDITDGDMVYACIDSYYPIRVTKNGTPTGKYKKYDDSRQEIIRIIKETVSKWSQLSQKEKDRLCSEDSILDQEEEMTEGLHIMTFHKSKGLEFDYVFVHMDNGMCPKVNNFSNLDSLEEDVRLAYVAVTRAKKRVYLCSQNIDTVSPFVALSNTECTPIHAKSISLPSEEQNKNSIRNFESLLDCYYMLGNEGIYMLKNNNTIMGYRYATMVNGSRVYFQSKLKDVVKAGIVVDETKDIEGVVEVMTAPETGNIITYEELNNTATVINVDDEDIIKSLFDGNYNPLKAIAKYYI